MEQLRKMSSNLCYCYYRNKMMMYTALEGFNDVVIDLTNYTVRKSIPNLDRIVDERFAIGVGS